MLTFLNENLSLEELYTFFFEPKPYSVYTLDSTESALHKWNTLKSKLPSGNIKSVLVKSKYSNSQHFLDFTKKFKEDNPKINLFAGYVETVECVERLYHSGVDVVVLSDFDLETLDDVIDHAKINNKYVATYHHNFLIPVASGVDFAITDSFCGYSESGGKVVVHQQRNRKNF